jgi:TPR repeat protein
MPEVPEQIQENLQNLEIEANAHSRKPSLPPRDHPQSQDHLYQQQQHQPRHNSNTYEEPIPPQPQEQQGYHPRSYQGVSSSSQPFHEPPKPVSTDYDYPRSLNSTPKPHSAFPKLLNPPPNVPPSDDEKEVTLEQARPYVLTSNDPEMQLAWSQDALAYVEILEQYAVRAEEEHPYRIDQMRDDALSVVGFLSDQQHPRALFMKGMWLEFGKFGKPVDKKEAFRCYKHAADKGYARAEYRMGMQYETSKELIKAIQHYVKGADMGDSASNYRLGMMHLTGQHGQKQDYARGTQLIRQAAQSADENAPQGAYVYGMLQARELPGISVPELFLPSDPKSARENIERAAYLGFARAQYKMGQAYELSQLGCEFSPSLSLHYDALAARQGEPEAEMAVSKWFLCGSDGLFEKNEDLAFVYAQRAAKDNIPTAMFAMGYLYEIGMGTSKNLELAQDWYAKAAEAGNKDAAPRLEAISKQNTLSRKDHEKIALPRIKSMYGNARPERFSKLSGVPSVPALPRIDSSAVDMPDPSQVHSPVNQGYTSPTHAGPDRSANSTPYPMQDGPPPLLQNTYNGQRPDANSRFSDSQLRPNTNLGGPGRPSSAFGLNPNLGSPDMNPSNRPSSAFGLNPNLQQRLSQGNARPSSAFGLHPDIRPVSTASAPGPGGYGGYPPDQGRGRPNSSMGMGRGGPGPGPGYPGGPGQGPGYRASGPPGPYGAGAGRGQMSPPHGPIDHNKPLPPRLDIGFQAPFENPQGRNKLQKPQTQSAHPGARTSSIPPAQLGYQAPLTPVDKPAPLNYNRNDGRNSARPDRHDSGSQSAHPSMGSGGLSGVQTRPSPAPRPDSRESTSTIRPQSSASQRPPAQTRTPLMQAQAIKPADKPVVKPATKPQGAKPAPAKPAAAPSKTSGPGGGPSTFEDMGIPQAKKDEDCVSTLNSLKVRLRV